jgi:hypothetical protein
MADHRHRIVALDFRIMGVRVRPINGWAPITEKNDPVTSSEIAWVAGPLPAEAVRTLTIGVKLENAVTPSNTSRFDSMRR